jgi:hypothetical protein
MKLIYCLILIASFSIISQAETEKKNSKTNAAEKKSVEEKESELLDFNSIKKVLKSDQLTKQVKNKKRKITKLKKRRVQNRKLKFDIPGEKSIWSFLSEVWLIQNVSIVKWDFKKPDYGIETSFKAFLEDNGYYEQTIKILLVNTPNITHMAIPANKNEFIFLLSVPFIRTLDLSKLEISVLLFEDFIRVKKGYFKNYVTTKKINKLIGSNFEGKKFDSTAFKNLFRRYDEIIYAKGFTFQQQFEVTKSVGAVLKANLKLWNTYFGLLKKIDDLIKSNILYSNYVKIYPSPEMQINWLKPKRTVL